MSCPDWSRLLAARESLGGADPGGWRDALEHLESCAVCRRDALRREPLLALRQLPAPALEPDEGRRMVAAVRALARRQATGRRWRQRAAAAVAVVGVGAGLTGGAWLLERSGDGSVERGAADSSGMVPGIPRPAASGTGPDLTSGTGPFPRPPASGTGPDLTSGTGPFPRPPASGTGPDATSAGGAVPSVLDLEQGAARVYEVSDASLAVVVVVDQGFDLEG